MAVKEMPNRFGEFEKLEVEQWLANPITARMRELLDLRAADLKVAIVDHARNVRVNSGNGDALRSILDLGSQLFEVEHVAGFYKEAQSYVR
jgi:hypothetical protein